MASYTGPRDKYDLDAVSRLSALDPTDLEGLIPELLGWLQDINWPVARPISELLSKCGTNLIPHVKEVLSSSDAIWKYWVLSELVSKLSPNVQAALASDLRRLSSEPTEDERIEEVHLRARDLLKGLGTL